MPIRFRCAYCNQLMAIAHRKAGTVVHCPKCAGQVVVPHPEPAKANAAVPSPAAALEKELDLSSMAQGSVSAPPPPTGQFHDSISDFDAEPVAAGTLLSPHMLLVATGVGGAIVGFVLGYFVGRS